LSLKWKRTWNEYQTTNERRICVTLTSRIFKKRLKFHDKLFKAENNLITQMRIDRIDLTNYLFHRIFDLLVRLIQTNHEAHNSFLLESSYLQR
jgi:uncharacterized membrane protein YdbT with pleckstrin-like domain